MIFKIPVKGRYRSKSCGHSGVYYGVVFIDNEIHSVMTSYQIDIIVKSYVKRLFEKRGKVTFGIVKMFGYTA